jgi:hypothetical protein
MFYSYLARRSSPHFGVATALSFRSRTRTIDAERRDPPQGESARRGEIGCTNLAAQCLECAGQ